MALYITFLAVVGIALIIVNYAKYRDLPQSTWVPGAAWVRAFIYFAFCNIVAAATGTTETILAQPLYTAEQLANPYWVAGAIGCTVYILVAYWGLWAKMTLTFDRKWYLGSALVFGIAWGLSTGQLLLSFYHVWTKAGLPGWATYLGAYACMGFWQYCIQDYWWDIYISPEHDSPRSIIIKTASCHIPNVALCLAFLAFFDNYAMYVAWQTLALVAAVIFQKFPAPWAEGDFHAPMVQDGWFGMPRGLGYHEELDPRSVRPMAPEAGGKAPAIGGPATAG